jgi:hypothetical protein
MSLSHSIIHTIFACARDGIYTPENNLPKPIDYCDDIVMQSLSTGTISVGIIALMVMGAQFFRFWQEEDIDIPNTSPRNAERVANEVVRNLRGLAGY